MADPQTVTMLELHKIRLDGDTQSRAEIDEGAAEDYAHDMTECGAELPPAVVFFDGRDYWLADGFTRYYGHRMARRSHLPCVVRKGTLEQAQLYAAGSNTKHGVRRRTEDRCRSILMVLRNPLSRGWTVERIADYCHVSPGQVRAMQRLEAGIPDEEPTLYGPEPANVPAEVVREVIRATGNKLRFTDERTRENLQTSYRQVGKLWAKIERHAAWQGVEVPEAVKEWLTRLAGRAEAAEEVATATTGTSGEGSPP